MIYKKYTMKHMAILRTLITIHDF